MLILSAADVESLLDTDALIDALAPAMADLSTGAASVPPRAAALIDAQTATGLLDMASYVPSVGALSSKLVSVFPANAGGELPVRQAVIVAFDPTDGRPAALIDATNLTAARTGACSALSIRLLAREDAVTLAVLGTGVQARAHALAAVRVRDFTRIHVAGRDPAKVASFAADLEGELDREVIATRSYQAATEHADVVCAATYTVEPVVRREWIAPGVHITSVGYNPRGREVDDATVLASRLFVESRSAALSAVPPNLDLTQPLERGVIAQDHVVAELGEVVAGSAEGRRANDDITLYKSVGVAVQDAAAVALVLQAARQHGVGATVQL